MVRLRDGSVAVDGSDASDIEARKSLKKVRSGQVPFNKNQIGLSM